jgi:hypothetical protein
MGRCPLVRDVYCKHSECGFWFAEDGCCAILAHSNYMAETAKYMEEIEGSLKTLAERTYIADGTCPGH